MGNLLLLVALTFSSCVTLAHESDELNQWFPSTSPWTSAKLTSKQPGEFRKEKVIGTFSFHSPTPMFKN